MAWTVAEGAEVIEKSHQLLAAGRVHREAWAELLVRVLRDRGAVWFSGGSDVTDIVDLVFDRQTCLPCLTLKSGQTEERVTDVLTKVLRRFTLIVVDGVCDGCGHTAVVHRLDSNGSATA